MPATKKTVGKKTAVKASAKKPAAKKPAASRAAKSPPTTKTTHAKRIKERLHTTIRRTPKTVSENEFEEVTAAVLVIVAELAAEVAEVFAELLIRIERIEASLSR
jgi:hypothetical protein